MYLDEQGLIVQADGDGGDTAQREGMWNFVAPGSKIFYPGVIYKLEVKPGIWVRHPIQYPDTKDFSRDQTDPNIMSMGATQQYAPLKRMLKAQIKRFGFYQNFDLPMPATIGIYIRAFDFKLLYLFLILLDFFMLWSVVEALAKRNKPDDVDDNNLIMKFIQAALVMPTPFSWLARKLYSKLRPWNYGCPEWQETPVKDTADNHPPVSLIDSRGYKPVYGALRWYHRAEAGGNPDFAELYRPHIDKYFGGSTNV